MSDFCKNSIFLSQNEREIVNKVLKTAFDYLVEQFEKRDIQANIYLTGSLARQEPSIYYDNKTGLSLNSDIDLVIVTKQNYLDNEWILHMSSWLKNNYSSLIWSVICLNHWDCNKLKSCMEKDYVLSRKLPIYESFSLPSYIEPIIDIENYFETFINACANYYLHMYWSGETSNGIYKNVNYQYLKVILESLRFHLYEYKPSGFIVYIAIRAKKLYRSLFQSMN